MRAQGSLEYLIIIAAVLAISAIVVMFVTGAFGGTQTGAQFASCKQAAAKCKASHLLTPNDPCIACETACVDAGGEELFPGAIECCQAGKTGTIYEGATECPIEGFCGDGLCKEIIDNENCSNCPEDCGVCPDCYVDSDCPGYGSNVCIDVTCSGEGKCVSTNNNDPCADDSNECTEDVCSGGACAHNPLTGTNMCGIGMQGDCVNGVCDMCDDNDGDGYDEINPECPGSNDCDDNDGTIWQELPCYTDADGDTYGTGSVQQICSGATCYTGYSDVDTDCDDTDPAIWKLWTGIYVDADGDGHGTGSAVNVCGADTVPTGYTDADNTDCDDTNGAIWATVYGYLDTDGDGVGSGSRQTFCTSGSRPSGYVASAGDCAPTDGSKWRTKTCYPDSDGDGYGSTSGGASYCIGNSCPAGTKGTHTDCNDGNAAVNPGATEVCTDSIDNDCDGDTDCADSQCINTADCNLPPTASFTYSCTKLACSFTSTSSDPEGQGLTFFWTFGDGTTSTSNIPSHTYAYSKDDYSVTLTVKDPFNEEDSQTQTLSVTKWNTKVVTSICGNPSIAMYTSTKPRISCTGSLKLKLYHSSDGGSSWSVDTVATGNALGVNSLVLDGSSPKMSYYDGSNKNVKYAYYSGGWQTYTPGQTSGDVGQWNSLALTSSGYPGIAYYDTTNTNLRFAYKVFFFGWFDLLVDDAGDVGIGNSVGWDSSGNSHMSYYDATNDDLKYAYYSGGFQTKKVDQTGDVGRFSSLEVASDNKVHIAYYDTDPTYHVHLHYVIYSGGSYYTELPSIPWVGGETNHNIGYYVSLALDSGNHPHLCYYDTTDQELEYAYHDGSSWSVDRVGYTSIDWCSIAVDSNNKPHIAYYTLGGQLKYAKLL